MEPAQIDAEGGMRIARENFSFYAGREYWGGGDRHRLRISIGIGHRSDAPLNEIPWRHWWSWSPELLRLIRDYDRRIIGFCAFGRCRIFR
jgi:hypothetical protein